MSPVEPAALVAVLVDMVPVGRGNVESARKIIAPADGSRDRMYAKCQLTPIRLAQGRGYRKRYNWA